MIFFPSSYLPLYDTSAKWQHPTQNLKAISVAVHSVTNISYDSDPLPTPPGDTQGITGWGLNHAYYGKFYIQILA